MTQNVVICGEHPALQTGFGIVTDRLVSAVIEAGMNPIVMHIRPASATLKYERCPVYACFVKSNRVEVFESHVKRIKPALVISIGDPWDVIHIAENRKKHDFKWVAYTPVESVPFCRYNVFDNKQMDVGRIIYLADKIVTYSEIGKLAIEDMFTREFKNAEKKDIENVYLGLDTSVFKPTDKKVSRKIFENISENTILFVCNKLDSSRVGYDLLIRSWDKFLRLLEYRRPDLRKRVKLYLHTTLNMVGGTDIPNLLKILDVGDTVMVNPALKYGEGVNQETMVDIINSADCYVSCAKGEGFGLPILESLACGIPVIAPDYGCPTEWGGDACSFVPIAEYYCPNFSYTNFALVDTDKYSEALFEIASSYPKRIEMGKAGIEIAKNFSWDIFQNKWIEVIKNNLGEFVYKTKDGDKKLVEEEATFKVEDV